VAFVSTARLPADDDRSGFFDGPPDLAVEVVSPRDSFGELAERIEDYLSAGTKLVWIVEPAKQTVTAYGATRRAVVLQCHETLTGGDVLPGFAEPVAQFFE
jgi:Uma2 family endonuclease